MSGEHVKVSLTRSQCRSLAEFIAENLFDTIRNDHNIDNLDWCRELLNAQAIFEEAGKRGSDD